MARRTAKQKKIEKRAALALVGVLVLAVLVVLTNVSPGATQALYRLLGITPAATPPATGAASGVAVHIIDVGQGSATLLQAGDEFALVDAGPPEGEAALLAYLEGAGVQALKLVVMTHPHADHIGGMEAVVEKWPVERVLLPNFTLAPYPTTSVFESLLATMVDKGIAAETAVQGAVYALGEGMVRVVHAGVETPDNYNLLSLGLVFRAGGFGCVVTGDGEAANERAMLESGEDLAATVLVAGHHGSNTSSKQAFVQAVSPRLVAISCAAGNSYGHPHRAPLAAFDEAGATVLRTDRQGHLVIQPGEDGRPVYGVEKNAA